MDIQVSFMNLAKIRIGLWLNQVANLRRVRHR